MSKTITIDALGRYLARRLQELEQWENVWAETDDVVDHLERFLSWPQEQTMSKTATILSALGGTENEDGYQVDL